MTDHKSGAPVRREENNIGKVSEKGTSILGRSTGCVRVELGPPDGLVLPPCGVQ